MRVCAYLYPTSQAVPETWRAGRAEAIANQYELSALARRQLYAQTIRPPTVMLKRPKSTNPTTRK
eukprot:8645501-Pyramimonas_sp.AAC.1